jgi:hypothetical protein
MTAASRSPGLRRGLFVLAHLVLAAVVGGVLADAAAARLEAQRAAIAQEEDRAARARASIERHRAVAASHDDLLQRARPRFLVGASDGLVASDLASRLEAEAARHGVVLGAIRTEPVVAWRERRAVAASVSFTAETGRALGFLAALETGELLLVITRVSALAVADEAARDEVLAIEADIVGFGPGAAP